MCQRVRSSYFLKGLLHVRAAEWGLRGAVLLTTRVTALTLSAGLRLNNKPNQISCIDVGLFIGHFFNK